MNNSSDTIGNRTRDLPACSAVPQCSDRRKDVTKLIVVFSQLRLKTLVSVTRGGKNCNKSCVSNKGRDKTVTNLVSVKRGGKKL
jgi:hypothetical protein